MTARRFTVALSCFLCGAVLAQSTSEEVTIADRFEANTYYAERERAIWRENADLLAALNEAYADAIAALSEENSRRIQALMAENSAAHKELAESGLSAEERAAESRRIQSETQRGRAEIQSWLNQAREQLTDEHAANRAAQTAAAQELIDRLREQRTATRERIVSGPVNVAALPPLTTPDDTTEQSPSQAASGVIEDSTGGPAASGGGVDVAGTVPLDQPGEEVVAQAVNEDMQRLREQMYRAEQERRRRAEEEAERRAREARNRREWRGRVLTEENSNDRGSQDWDCDDAQASVYPGAPEICNYIDDDCDTLVDEGLLATKYLDRDGDLHGDPGASIMVCAQTTQNPDAGGTGEWLSTYGNDCDDTDPSVWNDCGQ